MDTLRTRESIGNSNSLTPKLPSRESNRLSVTPNLPSRDGRRMSRTQHISSRESNWLSVSPNLPSRDGRRLSNVANIPSRESSRMSVTPKLPPIGYGKAPQMTGPKSETKLSVVDKYKKRKEAEQQAILKKLEGPRPITFHGSRRDKLVKNDFKPRGGSGTAMEELSQGQEERKAKNERMKKLIQKRRSLWSLKSEKGKRRRGTRSTVLQINIAGSARKPPSVSTSTMEKEEKESTNGQETKSEDLKHWSDFAQSKAGKKILAKLIKRGTIKEDANPMKKTKASKEPNVTKDEELEKKRQNVAMRRKSRFIDLREEEPVSTKDTGLLTRSCSRNSLVSLLKTKNKAKRGSIKYTGKPFPRNNSSSSDRSEDKNRLLSVESIIRRNSVINLQSLNNNKLRRESKDSFSDSMKSPKVQQGVLHRNSIFNIASETQKHIPRNGGKQIQPTRRGSQSSIKDSIAEEGSAPEGKGFLVRRGARTIRFPPLMRSKRHFSLQQALDDFHLERESRKMDFASVVDILIFKKMYYKGWKNHIERFLHWENTTPTLPPSPGDSQISSVTDEKTKRMLNKLLFKRVDVPPFSAEGQLSLLRCYDEKIRYGIGKLYPRYKMFIYSTKTPNMKSLANMKCQVTSLPSLGIPSNTNPEFGDLRSHLNEAGSLLDSVRAAGGQTSVRQMQTRPVSKELVRVYNTWTRQW